MFEYLTGAIVDTAPTYIVIDVNGVGYRLACANPFRWQVNPSDKVKVYVYQAVREDAITLYGFVSAEEKIDQLRANEPLDFNVPASDIEMTTELRDALAALTALGYPERSVKKVQKALSKEPAMSTDDYLRQGLRFLR